MARRPSKRRPVRFRVGRSRSFTVPPYPSSNRYIGYIRDSFKSIEENFRDFVLHVEDVEASIIEEGLEIILEQSLQYVPVATGALRDSAFIQTREMTNGPLTEIGYAKAGHPFYAGYVHEIPTYRHAGNTSHKFLQRAIDERLDQAMDHIRDRHKEIVGG